MGQTPGSVASTWWTYPAQGVYSGTWTTSDSSKKAAWTIPSIGGPYVVYYFCCDPSYTILGTSAQFDILPVPTGSPVTLQCRPAGTTASNIKHIILIVHENHSFDNYFGAYCTAAAWSNPTCTTGPPCCEAAPSTVNNKAPTALTDDQNYAFDPDHSMSGELCKQNGGLMNKYMSGQGCSSSDDRNFAVANEATMSTYFSYAQKYAIADRHFQSAAGASSENDMFFARGTWEFQDNAYVPKSAHEPAICATNTIVLYDQNIADLLISCNNVAPFGVPPFAVYAEGYNAAVGSSPACWPYGYDASDIPFAYYNSLGNGDNPNYFKDYTQFATDVANGQLAAYTYMKASGLRCGHPGTSSITGEEGFTAEVVDAIMSSSLYKSNTLIIVTPDESGGYYDHVTPPTANSYDGYTYGPRTWFLAIGAMTKTNYVSHVQIEPASIIKFVEWNWLAGTTGQVCINLALYTRIDLNKSN